MPPAAVACFAVLARCPRVPHLAACLVLCLMLCLVHGCYATQRTPAADAVRFDAGAEMQDEPGTASAATANLDGGAEGVGADGAMPPRDRGQPRSEASDAGADAGFDASCHLMDEPSSDDGDDGGIQTGSKGIKGILRFGGVGEIGGEGDFDASIVVRTFKRHLREVRACYERALDRDPTLHGETTVELTIGARGETSDVGLAANTLCDGEVVACVLRIVDDFAFNPGAEGGSVTYSYTLGFEPRS